MVLHWLPQKYREKPGHINIRLGELGAVAPGSDWFCCTCQRVVGRGGQYVAHKHGQKQHRGEKVHVVHWASPAILEHYLGRARVKEERRQARKGAGARAVGQGAEGEDEDDGWAPEYCFFPADVTKGPAGAQTLTVSGRLNGILVAPWAGMTKGLHIEAHLDRQAEDSIKVAVAWASNWLADKRVWSWLTQDKPAAALRLTRRTLARSGRKDGLLVSMSRAEQKRGGASAGAAAGLGLVCLAIRGLARTDVVVTGYIDLRGNVRAVAGLAGKVVACWEKRELVRTLVVPMETLEGWDAERELPTQELRDYVTSGELEIRGVRHMAEVVQLALEDCPALPEGLVLQHYSDVSSPERVVPPAWVGVAYALSYAGPQAERFRDTPLVIEVALIRSGGLKGSGDVVVTGVGGETMRQLVRTALGLVASFCETIARELGVPSFRAFLEQHTPDFHVNFIGGYEGMAQPLYMAPVAAAIVSCLTRRRLRRDVALSGKVSVDGELHELPVAVTCVGVIENLVRQGFQELVVGGWEAVAEKDQEDAASDVALREAIGAAGVSVRAGSGYGQPLASLLRWALVDEQGDA